MTREQQKEVKEANKELPKLIRNLKKDNNFNYANGFLYRFEMDYVYYAIISIPTTKALNNLSVSFFVKPWVLNETYWKVLEMDLDEMISQPKSFHVRGAFTIADIIYETWSYPIITGEHLSDAVNKTMKEIDYRINELTKKFKDINSIFIYNEQYNIPKLAQVIAYIFEEDYAKAIELIAESNTYEDSGTYIHTVSHGKDAFQYAKCYCEKMLDSL